MELNEIITKIRNARDYGSLEEKLGKELGTLIYQLVHESDKVDKTLDNVHDHISELNDLI
jgi:NTP pyrophosphatase (non-canonical NTP hydrolase)